MSTHVYDIIVIGAGHAGCEAAYAGAKAGLKTLLLTMNLDTIAKMSCNPSIGGTAKGHIVREIDALGGLMGEICEKSAIHKRLLNASKGPAVRSPRAQCDKWHYSLFMKQRLEQTENLDLFQASVEDLIVEEGKCRGVRTKEGLTFTSAAVIICSGTFLKGALHVGSHSHSCGRGGDPASSGISQTLEKLGLKLGRLKTGTPARIHARDIDYSLCEVQPSDEDVPFCFDQRKKVPSLGKVDCFITYTNETTHKIIQENIKKSPLFSGLIKGVGPRYCPSIEDKVVRFASRDRHQIFIEPEGIYTDEIYLSGISTSLPYDVQEKMLHSIPSLRNARIMRYGYAIEYDFVLAGQVDATLQTKSIEGLYLAGQINGTTGYEEAAAQGLVAGINAAACIKGQPAFMLSRSESYIGVMLDDLVTKELTEPYRMFTSRAEHRLLLRQDNADLRLSHYGSRYGLLDAERLAEVNSKKEQIQELIAALKQKRTQLEGKSVTCAQILCRPDSDFTSVYPLLQRPETVTEEVAQQVVTELRYEGYIKREMGYVQKLKEFEEKAIPRNFDFLSLQHLRTEARQKLAQMQPQTLAQASQIQGVGPADLQLLLLAISS